MDPIPEEVETTEESAPPSRILENITIKNQTMKNNRFKDAVNVEFTNCSFNSCVFQTLSRCSFSKCEFVGCTFHKNVTNVKFLQCKQRESNFTQIVLQDCLFEKTLLNNITAMFSKFDACKFIDGELSSKKTKKCTFTSCGLLRFNILPGTLFENATFTGTKFDSLLIRQTNFADTDFKNCKFKTINQTQSMFMRCSFPYTSLWKCSFNDNQFNRCKYDHFVVKMSNVLRNSFEGSTMDHTSFERSNFSYNNLEKGTFHNINFTFCTTRENNKKDATFCNSEMLTSSQIEVVCKFKDGFNSTDSYQYGIKLVSANGREMTVPNQIVTVAANAPSVTFLVSYDLLNLASMVQIIKTSTSAFGSIFNYSASDEEVIRHVCIDDKIYMYGKKIINGNTFFGFISPKSTRKIRSKSL